MKLRLEVWKSDNNQEEVHLFHGLRYVIGLNPRIVKKDDRGILAGLLQVQGYEFPKEFWALP